MVALLPTHPCIMIQIEKGQGADFWPSQVLSEMLSWCSPVLREQIYEGGFTHPEKPRPTPARAAHLFAPAPSTEQGEITMQCKFSNMKSWSCIN